jgi:hypothetical chaperone protein
VTSEWRDQAKALTAGIPDNEVIYAVDFGTSNSLLAAATPRSVVPAFALDAANASDATVMRSILYTPVADSWSFGSAAIEDYAREGADGRLFRSIKKYLPDPAFAGTTIHGRRYNLSELVAVFLKEMRRRANEALQRDVDRVVLGRPAAFSLDAEKDALAQKRLEAAAGLAGFKHVEFCPEPIAAAFEFRHQLTAPQTVLIADFGGGTSDFTVLRLSSAPFVDKDVMALGGIPVAGDMVDGAMMKGMIAPHFGSEVVYRMPMGQNDLRLPQHLLNRLCSPADISFLAKQDIVQLMREAQKWSVSAVDARRLDRLFTLVEEHLGYRLFREIERTKIELSERDGATFRFEWPGIEVVEEIAAADFRLAAREQVDKIVGALDQTVRDAGIGHREVDIVCCTGGTAKLPALRHELERRFGKDKLRQHKHFHSVITGLADRARQLLAR